jgi:hypothetical protein
MDHAIVCKCGQKEASFNFRNEVMPPEAIEALHCPKCSSDILFDPDTMLKDNGWVIKYDMDVAGLYGHKLPAHEKDSMSPELLFDEGYITWRGVYPGDHIDSVREREKLAKLAKENPQAYFKEMKTWGIKRMTRLKDEGWRKAYEG